MEILKHFMPQTVLHLKWIEIFWTTKQNVTWTLQVNKGWWENHRTNLSLSPSIRSHFSVLCKNAVSCWHYIVSEIEKWISIELMYIQPVLDSPSKVKHKPFQEAVRLSICLTFELNFPIRNNVNWINLFKISKIYSL